MRGILFNWSLQKLLNFVNNTVHLFLRISVLLTFGQPSQPRRFVYQQKKGLCIYYQNITRLTTPARKKTPKTCFITVQITPSFIELFIALEGVPRRSVQCPQCIRSNVWYIHSMVRFTKEITWKHNSVHSPEEEKTAPKPDPDIPGVASIGITKRWFFTLLISETKKAHAIALTFPIGSSVWSYGAMSPASLWHKPFILTRHGGATIVFNQKTN